MKLRVEDSAIIIPPSLLTEIRAAADEEKRPAEDLLREAIERYLENRHWQQLVSYGHQRARELGLTRPMFRVSSLNRDESGSNAWTDAVCRARRRITLTGKSLATITLVLQTTADEHHIPAGAELERAICAYTKRPALPSGC
jgi:hypothetical protein